MEEPFPSRMLRDIETSGITFVTLGDTLQVYESTIWRLRQALRRGVLPDLALVIAVYWALGYDKREMDAIARRYRIAKQAIPLRRETSEHRRAIKNGEDKSTEPLSHQPARLRVT